MSLYDVLRSFILPLNLIDSLIPKKGKIVDLGCGEGIIAKHLAKNRERQVIGIDNNKKRLGKSNQNNLKFICGDILNFDLQGTDGIVLSDVLHHISYSNQKRLIASIAQKLKKDGVLVIKEINRGEFLRSKLSRFWDLLLYPKDKIFYWNSGDLKDFLKKSDFDVKIVRTSRFFPGSTTLFICKK